MPGLEVRGLTKRFGATLVADNISFDVRDGEFFVLLGPSGGGKSTLLRVLCGLEKADAGQIFLNGVDITNLTPRERNIGMVFQDYGLYPNMDTFGNIAYGLEARGVPRAEVDTRVRAAAEKLGLTPLLKRNVVDLSGGEQQRVALARAIAKDAALYLYDEPLANLDPKLRSQARRDILTIHQEKGKPSLYVTHDQTEAFAIADRIGIIAFGRLQQVGSAEDLINHPANLFVAGFVGAPGMNLVSCSLERRPDHSYVSGDGVRLPLPDHLAVKLSGYRKDQVVLGIRPDSLTIGGGHIPCQIDNVTPLVSETLVTFRAGRNTYLTGVFTEDESDFIVGQNTTLGLDVDRLCLFDPDTELAIRA